MTDSTVVAKVKFITDEVFLVPLRCPAECVYDY